MFESFLAAFSLIAVSELGDRTQVSALMLGARYHKSHRSVFLGVMAGFALCFLIAVTLGSAVIAYFSLETVKIFSSVVFIGMGLFALLRKENEKAEIKNKKAPFLASFSLITLSEFGDKTQIAAMLLSASLGDADGTFLGSMLAIAVLSGSAIFAGKQIAKRIRMHWIKYLSGAVFVMFGLVSLFGI